MYVHVTLSLPVGSLIIYSAKSRTQNLLNKIIFWYNFNQDKRKLKQQIFSFSPALLAQHFWFCRFRRVCNSVTHFVRFFIMFREVQFFVHYLLRTFLVVQQRNHHFVTLSLEEMAARFAICIQDSKCSGESGADYVCLRACVSLKHSIYASQSYCTAVERGIFIYLIAG